MMSQLEQYLDPLNDFWDKVKGMNKLPKGSEKLAQDLERILNNLDQSGLWEWFVEEVEKIGVPESGMPKGLKEILEKIPLPDGVWMDANCVVDRHRRLKNMLQDWKASNKKEQEEKQKPSDKARE